MTVDLLQQTLAMNANPYGNLSSPGAYGGLQASPFGGTGSPFGASPFDSASFSPLSQNMGFGGVQQQQMLQMLMMLLLLLLMQQMMGQNGQGGAFGSPGGGCGGGFPGGGGPNGVPGNRVHGNGYPGNGVPNGVPGNGAPGGWGGNSPSKSAPAEPKGTNPANPNAQIPSYNNPSKAQAGQMLDAAADKYGIPPEILKAVAWQESGWNPRAVGDGGNSFGMMQIYRVAHPDYNVPRGKADPAYNIDYGARFLKGLYNRYGSWGEAVKHYNGSGPAADRYRNSVLSLARNKPWGSA